MTGRRCPTQHRNTVEDRVYVTSVREANGKLRLTAWVVYRCRDCGAVLEEPYAMRRSGDRRAVGE